MEERNELEGIDLYAEGSAYPAVKLAVPHGDDVTPIRLLVNFEWTHIFGRLER